MMIVQVHDNHFEVGQGIDEKKYNLIHRARGIKRLLLLSVAIAVSLAGALLLNLSIPPNPVSAQSPDTDWPQLGRDPQRTSFTSQTVRTGNNAIKWLWHPDDRWASMAHAAQPVIASGIVVMGDTRGTVHALNESDGSTRWTFDTGMIIYGSAAIAGDRVFIGSQNGIFYALSAADGRLLWQYQTGGGITGSPLLFQDRVYIGSKDGKVYSFDQAAGSLIWARDTGAPVLMSAAASSDGKIFIGSENMQAFAFAADTGQQLWVSQLQGDSFRYYWPVVSDTHGVVVFRTEPAIGFHNMLGDPEPMLENGRCTSFYFGECHPDAPAGSSSCSLSCDGFSSLQSTPELYQAEQTRIRDYLDSNPDRETFYVLRTSDGSKAYTAPVLYTSGSGWSGAPIALDEAGNVAYVIWRTYYSRYDSGTTVRPYVDIGKMDLATGVITHFACGSIGGESCRVGWDDFHLVADETSRLTAAGNALLVSNQGSLGGVDLVTERSFFTISATGRYRTDLVMQNQQWGDSDTYAGFQAYPIDHVVIANGVIYYKSGLLGAIQ